jgi:CHAT domain-containing protein
MNYCLAKVVMHIFLFCVIAVTKVYAISDSLSLPPALIQQLDNHRRQDDLIEWTYARIAYVEKKPSTRIAFLMNTQQEAWRPYKSYEERLAWYDLLNLQGYYQLQTGNILSSINFYEAALQFYESYPLPDADLIEPVLKPLGNNYTRLADYKTALFIHQKTLALVLKKNDHHTIASVYSNMAICARSMDDLMAATRYCRTGLSYTSPQHALYGLLLSTLADVLAEQHKYDSAGIVCNKSLQQLQRHKSETITRYWYASTLQIASKIALYNGQYRQAVDYGKQALAIFQQYYPSSRQREKAKVYVLLGNIFHQTGDNGQALQHYQEALRILIPSPTPGTLWIAPSEDQLYSENTLTEALTGKAATLQSMQKKEASLQHYMAAFMAERKLRKEFFYAESKLKELQVTRSRVEAAMKLAYNLWTTSGNKKFLDQLLLIAEISRAQVLMDERRSRIEMTGIFLLSDSLSRKSKQLQQAISYYQHELLTTADKKNITILLQAAEYELSLLNKNMKQQTASGQTDDKLLTVQQVYNMFKRIPANVTVLEFFAGRDSSFVIELDNTGITAVHLIPESGSLHKAVQHFMHQWFASGPAPMVNAPRSFYRQCNELYTAVFKNVQWKKERSYLLMPDGMFNYLPFDALLTDTVYRNNYREWPYLFKQVALSQAYSLQTWYEQQSATYPPGPFAAFFVSKGKEAKQAALSIEEEYRALSKKISGNYYVNASATWSSFNTVTDSTGILHISTHAVSSAGDSFPYLQLYDKPFYLFDLRYKHFSPSLVVLGACKTADGLLMEGEGVNSISRGFTAAGAGGVISGLWNVNDQTSIELLQLFYEQLQQQSDPAAALHQAKQQWLQRNQENAILQLPYYWAGFVYSGHLQKVHVAEIKRYRFPWWATLLIFPMALFLVLKIKRRKR